MNESKWIWKLVSQWKVFLFAFPPPSKCKLILKKGAACKPHGKRINDDAEIYQYRDLFIASISPVARTPLTALGPNSGWCSMRPDASRNPPPPPLRPTPQSDEKEQINKKEIMEAMEGKYTFGAVISGFKLAIWVFWWSYLGRDISKKGKETSCFRGLSSFSGLFKRGHVPSFT